MEEEVKKAEQRLINYIRQVKNGKLLIVIQDGVPISCEESLKKVKFYK